MSFIRATLGGDYDLGFRNQRFLEINLFKVAIFDTIGDIKKV
jgi:hypothetical protein